MTVGVRNGDRQLAPGKARLNRFALFWAALIALAFLSNLFIGRWDNATELTPNHSDILDYCFDAAGTIALISAAVAFLGSRGSTRARVVLALCFAVASGIALVLLAGTLANIVENRIDFPAGKTQTFRALLPIGRAYRMDPRTGSSWIIQPVIWTNIDITQADYRFMLSHRGWDGVHAEPKSISSNGYFCANVLMQRSGDALRVLNAGTSKLPSGTIGICSEMASKDPSLTIIS